MGRRSWKELEDLAAVEGEPYLQYALAVSHLARDRLDDARKAVERARRAPLGTLPMALNNLAYLDLFWSTPEALRAGLPDLERLARGQASSAAIQNTLGLYYAALGRPRDALGQVHRSVAVRGHVTPADHLVLGRLAAALGLRSAARREYELAMADPDKRPDSVRDLSRRWMAALPR